MAILSSQQRRISLKIIQFKRKGRRPRSPIMSYYLVFSMPMRKVMISLHTHKGEQRRIYARLQVDDPYDHILASGTGRGYSEQEAIQLAFERAGIEGKIGKPEKALMELTELIGYVDIILINGAYQ